MGELLPEFWAGLKEARKEGKVHRNRKVTDIYTWLQCFGTYVAVRAPYITSYYCNYSRAHGPYIDHRQDKPRFLSAGTGCLHTVHVPGVETGGCKNLHLLFSQVPGAVNNRVQVLLALLALSVEQGHLKPGQDGSGAVSCQTTILSGV